MSVQTNRKITAVLLLLFPFLITATMTVSDGADSVVIAACVAVVLIWFIVLVVFGVRSMRRVDDYRYGPDDLTFDAAETARARSRRVRAAGRKNRG
ncbi:hypothetical protein JVX90_12195 [Gordonia sp. PDNC005]|uniref:hypothetical protein n=1 Tax=unclassified Gordonia (in: high G+C Gram-positive bacteria) TaxID=2657482 RepID=UPI0019658413|nr:hypothetical protein [Gordonia sp. PDNC005]QRY61199.1 hypothetical protein JVX90_12195 [Gordonia sp. PDNC005]